APGDEIASTMPDGEYGYDSGTSFATPQVAGVAALIKSAHPSWTAPEIKQAIMLGVDTRAPFAGKCVSGGALNAYKSLGGNYDAIPGSVIASFNPRWTLNGGVYALAAQADGKLLAGGYTSSGNGAAHRLARFNANGAIDTSFAIGTGPTSST